MIFSHKQSRREDSQIVPDGLFSATLWNKNRVTIALELELHAKTTQRYKKIFIKYMDKKNLSMTK